MYICCVYIYITQSLFNIPKTYTSIKKKKTLKTKIIKRNPMGFFPKKLDSEKKNEYSLYV